MGKTVVACTNLPPRKMMGQVSNGMLLSAEKDGVLHLIMLDDQVPAAVKAVSLRHELKHQINLREDLVLSQRLRKLFPRDKNASSNGTYRVTSLYFDTPYDNALREKLDGLNRREKFRLRYYGTDISFIRLEKKWKENGLCGKRSAQLTMEQVKKLLMGDYEYLLQSGNPLLIEFYSKLQGKGLRPKTIVSYDRGSALWATFPASFGEERSPRSSVIHFITEPV